MRQIQLLVLLSVLPVAATAYATMSNLAGTVVSVKVHDNTAPGLAGSYWDVFTITGVPTNGTCLNNGTTTTFAIADTESGKRMLSLVTAAQLAGKTVKVRWDDTFKAPNGPAYFCKATAVELL